MKWRPFVPGLIAAGALMSSGAVADPPSAAGTGSVDRVIPAGTEFEVALDRALGTETNQAGDRWSATLVEPITDGERVLVAKGAVTGVVTEAGSVEVRGETRQVLALEPRNLQLNGRRHEIQAEVVAARLHEHDGRLTRENIAIIGGGGAGALPSALLGDGDEAVLGAILDGAAATVVAVATEETEIELHEGATLRLRLLQDVRLGP